MPAEPTPESSKDSPLADKDTLRELEEIRAANRADIDDRQSARLAALRDKENSGEVPVVRSSERYDTGQTPVVKPEDESPEGTETNQ